MTEEEKTMTLKDLKEGDSAVIDSLTGQGAFRRRLLEMGFMGGTPIYVKKYAPLRDPIEFVIKGYHVSLRQEEASQVLVKPDSIIRDTND
jgi:Fe2+ transport system protein FeoA